jgi:uncharacterized protein with HEPN domain
VKDDKLYLINILECISRIELYTGPGAEAFRTSTLIQDAVIRNFEIIGEATKRLSSELRDSHTGIPWTRIAGFRDVLIHDYLGVDTNEVWIIVEERLPGLKKEIAAILGVEKQKD